ncbi:MAG: GNAT family N-acetyltransferase [Clostridia bacterium]|nr:GNAT family N-acetyltransferase [Clostridia bacterium]
MQLIKASECDAAAVAALYDVVKQGKYCVWTEQYPTIEHAVTDAAAGCLYLLVQGGKLIGCASVEPVPEDDDLPWQVCDGKHREISRVAIAPAHQGKGYAKKMVELLLEELRRQGVSSVHLLAAKSNPPAVNTYGALGFAFLGECHRYGADYYICELLLK